MPATPMGQQHALYGVRCGKRGSRSSRATRKRVGTGVQAVAVRNGFAVATAGGKHRVSRIDDGGACGKAR